MTGSQKFAMVLGAGAMILLAVAVFMYIYGPKVDARTERRAEQRRRDLSEMIETLDRETSGRGLYYYIYCTAYYEGDLETWRGNVTIGKTFNIWIEDGAASYWSTGTPVFNSKEEAAEELLRVLKEPPNTAPMHREDRKRVSCPAVSSQQ